MKKVLYIEGRREYYIPQDVRKTMTVKELREWLEDCDDEALVILTNDSGYTYGSITESSFEEVDLDQKEEE